MTDTERIIAARNHLNNNQDVSISKQLITLSAILDVPICEELRKYVVGLCIPVNMYCTDDELTNLRLKISPQSVLN